MDIITVNVGQGALTVVRHKKEAIIIDSRIPPRDDNTVAFVKVMLAAALRGYDLRGFVLTGFDDDHCDVIGSTIVLRKYRPDWVILPKYHKDTEEARLVRALIASEEGARRETSNPLKVIPVRLDQLASRRLPGLSSNFNFELFSPHPEDMNSSNNCSIVMKITGIGSGGFSYLVTGDTENDRWESISRLFGKALESDVLAAPHHGSKNAVHPASLININPHTVLISAGVDSQYGHPDPEAVRAYAGVARRVFATNMEGGVSLQTRAVSTEFVTELVRDTAA